MLVQSSAARHQQHRFLEPCSGQDRPDPCMTHDQATFAHQAFEFARCDSGARFHMLRSVAALAGLREDRELETRRDGVHRLDQPVKAQLHADGDDDHSTDPK